MQRKREHKQKYNKMYIRNSNIGKHFNVTCLGGDDDKKNASKMDLDLLLSISISALKTFLSFFIFLFFR